MICRKNCHIAQFAFGRLLNMHNHLFETKNSGAANIAAPVRYIKPVRCQPGSSTQMVNRSTVGESRHASLRYNNTCQIFSASAG